MKCPSCGEAIARGAKLCDRCQADRDLKLVAIGAIFEEASDTSRGCPHQAIKLVADDGAVLRCMACGKRWALAAVGSVKR